jgi:hypothetical protein
MSAVLAKYRQYPDDLGAGKVACLCARTYLHYLSLLAVVAARSALMAKRQIVVNAITAELSKGLETESVHAVDEVMARYDPVRGEPELMELYRRLEHRRLVLLQHIALNLERQAEQTEQPRALQALINESQQYWNHSTQVAQAGQRVHAKLQQVVRAIVLRASELTTYGRVEDVTQAIQQVQELPVELHSDTQQLLQELLRRKEQLVREAREQLCQASTLTSPALIDEQLEKFKAYGDVLTVERNRATTRRQTLVEAAKMEMASIGLQLPEFWRQPAEREQIRPGRLSLGATPSSGGLLSAVSPVVSQLPTVVGTLIAEFVGSVIRVRWAIVGIQASADDCLGVWNAQLKKPTGNYCGTACVFNTSATNEGEATIPFKHAPSHEEFIVGYFVSAGSMVARSAKFRSSASQVQYQQEEMVPVATIHRTKADHEGGVDLWGEAAGDDPAQAAERANPVDEVPPPRQAPIEVPTSPGDQVEAMRELEQLSSVLGGDPAQAGKRTTLVNASPRQPSAEVLTATTREPEADHEGGVDLWGEAAGDDPAQAAERANPVDEVPPPRQAPIEVPTSPGDQVEAMRELEQLSSVLGGDPAQAGKRTTLVNASPRQPSAEVLTATTREPEADHEGGVDLWGEAAGDDPAQAAERANPVDELPSTPRRARVQPEPELEQAQVEASGTDGSFRSPPLIPEAVPSRNASATLHYDTTADGPAAVSTDAFMDLWAYGGDVTQRSERQQSMVVQVNSQSVVSCTVKVAGDAQAGFTCNKKLQVIKLDPVCLAVDAGVALGMHVTAFQGQTLPDAMTWAQLKKKVKSTPKPWTFGFSSGVENAQREISAAACAQAVSEGGSKEQRQTGSSDSEPISTSAFAQMNLNQLKATCEEAGLGSHGLKADLLRRLNEEAQGGVAPNAVVVNTTTRKSTSWAPGTKQHDGAMKHNLPQQGLQVEMDDHEMDGGDTTTWLLVESFDESELPQLSGALAPFQPHDDRCSAGSSPAWCNQGTMSAVAAAGKVDPPLYIYATTNRWVIAGSIGDSHLAEILHDPPGCCPPLGENDWRFFSPSYGWRNLRLRLTPLGACNSQTAQEAAAEARQIPCEHGSDGGSEDGATTEAEWDDSPHATSAGLLKRMRQSISPDRPARPPLPERTELYDAESVGRSHAEAAEEDGGSGTLLGRTKSSPLPPLPPRSAQATLEELRAEQPRGTGSEALTSTGHSCPPWIDDYQWERRLLVPVSSGHALAIFAPFPASLSPCGFSLRISPALIL